VGIVALATGHGPPFAASAAALLAFAGLVAALLAARADLRRLTSELLARDRDAVQRQLADGDVVLRLDGEERLVGASPPTSALLGRDLGDLVGRRLRELAHPADRVLVRTHLASYDPGGVEYRLLRPDGELAWVESRATPLRDPRGARIGSEVSLRDITAHRQLELAVRSSERRFRLAFDHAPIGVGLLAADGTWLEVNEALCGILQRAREELVGVSLEGVAHPDEQGTVRDLVDPVLTGERALVQESRRFVWEDGTTVSTSVRATVLPDENGSPDAVLVQVIDLTEREAVGQMLALVQDHYRLLVETAPVGILETDADGECVYVNAGWSELSGLTLDEARGRGWRAAIHPADVDVVADQRDGQYVRELRYVRRDGTVAAVVEHTVPMAAPGEEPTGAITTVVDVTAQRAAEETARQAQENLIAVNDLVRSLQTSVTPREDLCRAFEQMAEAQLVVLIEPREQRMLQVTASTVAGLVGTRLGEDDASVIASCFVNGTRAIVTGGPADGDLTPADRAVWSETARSGIIEPVVHADRVGGVLVIGWDRALDEVGWQDLDAVELLAAEAAALIGRDDLLQQLAELARRDPLTGLPNRRVWDEELPRELSRHGRSGDVLAVAMIDLDHFKRFNDSYGHPAGDELLREVARAWASAIRVGDRLVRYGGEEFALLLTAVEPGRAAEVADRLRALMPRGTTCSIGVAEWDGIERADDLVGRADAALYEAKRAGRDRLVVAPRRVPATAEG
jgi:diguanylate cyclase (GGDEF)-like protein/PAS domain S-box-containing protein